MYHSFEFDPGPLRRWVGPHGIRAMLDQVLMNVWTFMPPEDKSIEAVCRRARKIVSEAAAWWRGLDRSQAGAVEPDAGLNLDDLKNEVGARLPARCAMQTCWNLLPEGRRSDNEVERIVDQMLERSLRILREDADLFEHPLR